MSHRKDCADGIRFPRIGLRGIFAAVLVSLSIGAAAEDSDQPNPDPARWENAVQAFERWDSKNTPAGDAVLFVGSSSIVNWNTRECFPDLPVINRGFGGSHVSDVNHFVARIVEPYRPRAIVLYAGDNDIAAGKSAQQMFEDYREFVRLVRATSPDVPVVFIAIKPSTARWNLWPEMEKANALIRKLTESDKRQFYAEIAAPMLGSDGKPRSELLVADGLHLTPEGYRVWTDVVRPLIAKCLESAADKSTP